MKGLVIIFAVSAGLDTYKADLKVYS